MTTCIRTRALRSMFSCWRGARRRRCAWAWRPRGLRWIYAKEFWGGSPERFAVGHLRGVSRVSFWREFPGGALGDLGASGEHCDLCELSLFVLKLNIHVACTGMGEGNKPFNTSIRRADWTLNDWGDETTHDMIVNSITPAFPLRIHCYNVSTAMSIPLFPIACIYILESHKLRWVASATCICITSIYQTTAPRFNANQASGIYETSLLYCGSSVGASQTWSFSLKLGFHELQDRLYRLALGIWCFVRNTAQHCPACALTMCYTTYGQLIAVNNIVSAVGKE